MIQPQRGIQQGDPLSPYLFILCSEVLSHLLTTTAGIKRLKGMKISNTGPTINHLLFADDALFFCHAHPKSCATIMEILQNYERVSGQAVNPQQIGNHIWDLSQAARQNKSKANLK